MSEWESLSHHFHFVLFGRRTVQNKAGIVPIWWVRVHERAGFFAARFGAKSERKNGRLLMNSIMRVCRLRSNGNRDVMVWNNPSKSKGAYLHEKNRWMTRTEAWRRSLLVCLPRLISIRIFLYLSWRGHNVRIFCAYRRALSHKANVSRVDHHFKERMQSWMWLSTNGRYAIRLNRWSIMAGKIWNRKSGIIRPVRFFRFRVRLETVSAGIPGWQPHRLLR